MENVTFEVCPFCRMPVKDHEGPPTINGDTAHCTLLARWGSGATWVKLAGVEDTSAGKTQK